MQVIITQLTDNGRNDSGPQISGNSIVWVGDDGHDSEIYYYNENTTTQLTNNSRNDNSPQISGNNVVWVGNDGHDSEIYYYNGATITQLTNNSRNDNSPQISGNNVVWVGNDGHDSEIYYYNGNSTTQLTNNNGNDYSPNAPQISGNNIVWQGYHGEFLRDIYYYNGDNIVRLTDNGYTDDLSPQISGNNIVWVGTDYYGVAVYYYNGNNTVQLTDPMLYSENPQISGNNIAWITRDRNQESLKIYYYDGNNTIQLANYDYNNVDTYLPTLHISGSNVAWDHYEEYDNGNYEPHTEMYCYIDGSIVQLTDNDDPRASYISDISGNNIVWSGNGGNSTEIFLAQIIPNNNSPTNINLSGNRIPENRPRNAFVGIFRSIDPDTGQTHSYSLVPGPGDTGNRAFRIVNNQLRTNQVFDYESRNRYRIRVRTTDNLGGTFEKVFTINITDLEENHPPTDILFRRNTIAENRPKNTFVGIFRAVDPDGIQNHTYSLVPGEGDADNNAFRIAFNNQLRTNQVFDYESQNRYSIRVRTIDNEGDSFEKAFTINITDVDEQLNLATGMNQGDFRDRFDWTRDMLSLDSGNLNFTQGDLNLNN